MLEAINWSTYFIILAIATTSYYLIIMGLYYKQEFRNLISGKFKQFSQNRQQEKMEQSRRTDENSDDHFEELETTVAELNGILGKAGHYRTSKETLLMQLIQTLSNHTGLREPAYRVAVINFILENAPKHCRISFNETELEEAWSAQSP